MTEATSTVSSEKAGIPQLDFTTFPNQIFWLVVFLVILFFIVSRIVLPRIEGIMDARKKRIKDDLNQAERATAETESIRKHTAQKLALAKANAETIAADTRTKIRDIQDQEMTRVSHEISTLTEESDKRINDIQDEAPEKIKEIMISVVPSIINFVLPNRAIVHDNVQSGEKTK